MPTALHGHADGANRRPEWLCQSWGRMAARSRAPRFPAHSARPAQLARSNGAGKDTTHFAEAVGPMKRGGSSVHGNGHGIGCPATTGPCCSPAGHRHRLSNAAGTSHGVQAHVRAATGPAAGAGHGGQRGPGRFSPVSRRAGAVDRAIQLSPGRVRRAGSEADLHEAHALAAADCLRSADAGPRRPRGGTPAASRACRRNAPTSGFTSTAATPWPRSIK